MSNYDENPDAPHVSPFESIRRAAEDGGEYWSARDLAKILSYDDYRTFLKAIEKACTSCEQSGQDVLDHIVGFDDMVSIHLMVASYPGDFLAPAIEVGHTPGR